nr:immunoglobulin heavy chain junction region [Macaca mulatta]
CTTATTFYYGSRLESW